MQHETAWAVRRLMRAAVGNMKRYIGVGSYHAMQGVVRAHTTGTQGAGVAPIFKGVVTTGVRISGCGDAIKCVVPPQPRRPGPGATVLCNYPIHRRRRHDVGAIETADAPPPAPRAVRVSNLIYPHGYPGYGEAGTRAPRTSDFALDSSVGSRPGPLGDRTLRRRTATVPSRRVKSCGTCSLVPSSGRSVKSKDLKGQTKKNQPCSLQPRSPLCALPSCLTARYM